MWCGEEEESPIVWRRQKTNNDWEMRISKIFICFFPMSHGFSFSSRCYSYAGSALFASSGSPTRAICSQSMEIEEVEYGISKFSFQPQLTSLERQFLIFFDKIYIFLLGGIQGNWMFILLEIWIVTTTHSAQQRVKLKKSSSWAQPTCCLYCSTRRRSLNNNTLKMQTTMTKAKAKNEWWRRISLHFVVQSKAKKKKTKQAQKKMHSSMTL